MVCVRSDVLGKAGLTNLKYLIGTMIEVPRADLKMIYRAATEPQARLELKAFESKCGSKYPSIVKLWELQLGNVHAIL